MSKLYSSVTKGANGKGGLYCQVHNPGKPGYKSAVTGYYVGGYYNPKTPKFKSPQLTIHLLQKDGTVVGVNLPGGLSTKIVNALNNGEKHVLFGSVGKFISISTGDTIEGTMSTYNIVNFNLVNAEFPYPKNANYELVYWRTAGQGRQQLTDEFLPQKGMVVEATNDDSETLDEEANETVVDMDTAAEGFGSMFGE